MRHGRRRPLSEDQIERTSAFIAAQQDPDGSLPWNRGTRLVPWDHVQATMGLAVTRRFNAARAAFRYLARTQESDGGWAAIREGGVITEPTHETNHAAYAAAGLWFLHCASPDPDFLAEMWPTIDRAIDFVVSMQEESGLIYWSAKDGEPYREALLTGSASIHGSLVCAQRIAERLDHDRPAWRRARERLAAVVRANPWGFGETTLRDQDGRYSMDWYYPVLGGAIRGAEARLRLLDARKNESYLEEGVGCRCVVEQPWYTTAETCELVLSLDACGLTSRAAQVFSWLHLLRTERGSYWTGVTHPDRVLYPDGEQTAWTAATALLAADALTGESATSSFFRDLAAEDLDEQAEEVEAEADAERSTGTDAGVRAESSFVE